MEELRDSYMLANIVAGKKAGVQLFGIGDVHRKSLEPLIKAAEPDIEVLPSEKFYRAQYVKHPDVD